MCLAVILMLSEIIEEFGEKKSVLGQSSADLVKENKIIS